MTLLESTIKLMLTPSKWLLSVQNLDLAVFAGVAGLFSALVLLGQGGFGELATMCVVVWMLGRLVLSFNRAQQVGGSDLRGSRTAYFTFLVVYAVALLGPIAGLMTFDQQDIAFSLMPVVALAVGLIARLGLWGALHPLREELS